jgi:FKBP-type peptidyl-prolyl cis-trans isomerase FkpA
MGNLSNTCLALVAISAVSLASPMSVRAGSDAGGTPYRSAQAAAPHPRTAMTQAEQDEALYALGVLISHNLEEFDLSSADFDRVKSGLIDGFNHRAAKAGLSRDGAKIQLLRNERLARLQTKREQAGSAFLDRTASLAGARRTASGLVYVPVREGSGASPGPEDQVVVNYEGRLIDGSVFDGSREHGGPATLSLRSVIPCWSEALPLMKVGGTSRIVCPAALAYGAHGEPPKVGPDAMLDFQVELLDVVAPAPRPASSDGGAQGPP